MGKYSITNDRRGIKIWSKDDIEVGLAKVDENSFTEGFDVEDFKRRGR